VIRLSAKWPLKLGSKRTRFRAPVFVTYNVPLVGLTTMLKSVVPTPLKRPFVAGGVAPASMAKTS
jgi:hypothetical protein